MNLGQYIWRTKDVDYPVTVTQFLGKGPDGREYASIAESTSAVPVDELQKEKSVKSVSQKPPRRRLF